MLVREEKEVPAGTVVEAGVAVCITAVLIETIDVALGWLVCIKVGWEVLCNEVSTDSSMLQDAR